MYNSKKRNPLLKLTASKEVIIFFPLGSNKLKILRHCFRTRRGEKGEPISSGYLSDHESKLHEMVQQYSVESQDSRLCYLTSSEVRK